MPATPNIIGDSIRGCPGRYGMSRNVTQGKISLNTKKYLTGEIN